MTFYTILSAYLFGVLSGMAGLFLGGVLWSLYIGYRSDHDDHTIFHAATFPKLQSFGDKQP